MPLSPRHLCSHCVVPEPPRHLHPKCLKPSAGLSPPPWQIHPLAQPEATQVDCAAPGQKAAAGPLVLAVLAEGHLTSMSPVRPVQGVDGPRMAARHPASALEPGFSPHSPRAGSHQGRAPLAGSISPACPGQMCESFQANITELIALMQVLLPPSSPPLLLHQTPRRTGETRSSKRATVVAS